MGCGVSTFRLEEDGGIQPVQPRNRETRIITPSPLHLHHHHQTASTTDARPSTTNDGRKSASSYASATNDFWSVRNSLAQEDEIDHCDGATRKFGEEGIERGLVLVAADGSKAEEEAVEGDHTLHELEAFSDSDGPIFMRSPSFREYCVVYNAVTKDEDEDDDDNGNFDREKENETQRKEGIPCPDTNQGTTTQLVKKGRKGRRLRVFPAGKSAAVKNLLNVTTCYSPSASSEHNTLGKPVEKAT